MFSPSFDLLSLRDRFHFHSEMGCTWDDGNSDCPHPEALVAQQGRQVCETSCGGGVHDGLGRPPLIGIVSVCQRAQAHLNTMVSMVSTHLARGSAATRRSASCLWLCIPHESIGEGGVFLLDQ